ncbi:NAD(P)/FAD-dependent oxidoreductase [Leptolyngbya ohadii]|uniref:NAD(P)/FAD-dependent oxidoreductase n=1 Tax=Leptolyngbya ohadii TaxID=1962290 RepID=UPI000B5A10F6|nr:FAD-dependent oxidoreductase [Leptolyngbya ohadii]
MHIAILGCGAIGAMTAYELSQQPDLKITVIDRQLPAQGATQAALGVLMGAISQKVKGRAWNLREISLKRYETLIPELEQATGDRIPFNRQGIVKLCLAEEESPDWDNLIATRQSQGWHLERWELAKLRQHCPQITSPRVTGAIYSADDRQLDPKALTLSLIQAARQRGVQFRLQTEITGFESTLASDGSARCHTIALGQEQLNVDAIVVTAGLGSTPLLKALQQGRPSEPEEDRPRRESLLEIRPVLGQAVRMRLAEPLGSADFQPVVTGNDIHLVPLGDQKYGGREYWVGATVEFPPEVSMAEAAMVPVADRLRLVLQGAIDLCPVLASGEIIQQWSGLRPRPHQRPAPVIEPMPDYQNVIVATGHYRNGILLAPATAQEVRSLIKSRIEIASA